MRSNYKLLYNICQDNKENQLESYKFIDVFIRGLFKSFGAEDLLMEIFVNNL